jgi:hypothetical protein
MSDQQTETEAPARQTGEGALAADLRRYGDALVPGAAEVLARRNQQLAQLPPAERAEKIATLMESPLWANFRNPEHRPASLENGQPLSPVRAALSRHAAELVPGAVESLTQAWSASLAHLKPAQIAGEVVRRLAERDNRHHLASPPPLPANEQRLHAFLNQHFPELQGAAAKGRFVRERARELDPAGRPDHEALKAIAGQLRLAPVAARYGLTPLEPDDARILGRPRGGPSSGLTKAHEPARGPDGKFAQPPADPAKRRPPVTGF